MVEGQGHECRWKGGMSMWMMSDDSLNLQTHLVQHVGCGIFGNILLLDRSN